MDYSILRQQILNDIKTDPIVKSNSKALGYMIQNDKANYKTVADYSKVFGDAVSKNVNKNIPDGVPAEELAEFANDCLAPVYRQSQNTMLNACQNVQKSYNKKAGIGLNPADVKRDESRIQNIVDRFEEAESFEDVKFLTNENVSRSITRGAVNDSIKENAKMQTDAGLKVAIARSDDGGCCEWCAGLVGSYTNFAELPKDFWRMHRNCSCIIDYNVAKKRDKLKTVINNDGSYTETLESQNISDIIFNNARFRTQEMSEEQYALAVETWNKVEEVDIPQSEKEWVYQELDNNLTSDEKQSAIVRKTIGNFFYTAVNKGHNQYKIYQKELIDEPENIVDAVLTEMFGYNWEQYFEDSD